MKVVEVEIRLLSELESRGISFSVKLFTISVVAFFVFSDFICFHVCSLSQINIKPLFSLFTNYHRRMFPNLISPTLASHSNM